ncbi:MAG: hydroxyisourate hydrolase [Deltaproteobacteria bacterium]|nr:MAG: hydroxyisourate hydrolase [Deltaproteobacteria bacterium]
MRSPITTHVLDTATGRPAEGCPLTLFAVHDEIYTELASGVTNADGRVTDLLAPGSLTPGRYRMTFDVATYFGDAPSFYPVVHVDFLIVATDEHYHVPLLLSPYGYSTYRGS